MLVKSLRSHDGDSCYVNPKHVIHVQPHDTQPRQVLIYLTHGAGCIAVNGEVREIAIRFHAAAQRPSVRYVQPFPPPPVESIP